MIIPRSGLNKVRINKVLLYCQEYLFSYTVCLQDTSVIPRMVIFCVRYRLERVQQLVKAGVGVNTWDSQATRNTPLHWAACYADSSVVAFLIGILESYSW